MTLPASVVTVLVPRKPMRGANPRPLVILLTLPAPPLLLWTKRAATVTT
jgi:hypothetical protein